MCKSTVSFYSIPIDSKPSKGLVVNSWARGIRRSPQTTKSFCITGQRQAQERKPLLCSNWTDQTKYKDFLAWEIILLNRNYLSRALKECDLNKFKDSYPCYRGDYTPGVVALWGRAVRNVKGCGSTVVSKLGGWPVCGMDFKTGRMLWFSLSLPRTADMCPGFGDSLRSRGTL